MLSLWKTRSQPGLRAKFRKDWTARFQHIFARKCLPPDQNLASLRAFREAKSASNDDGISPEGEHSQNDEKWDTKRLRSRTAIKDGSPSGEELGVDESSDAAHGLCHTVLFRIDNSRPQEQIFHEQDFLDEEASGDEDWNGDNDAVEEGNGYAW